MDFLSNIFKNQASSQPLAFIIAAAIAFIITPIIRERAEKLGNSREEFGRDTLSTKPRLGGIAILLSIVITTAIYIAIYGRYTPAGIQHLELEAMALGSFIIFLVGLLDDIKPLNPFNKLIGQIIAATFAWLMHVRIDFLANPIYYIDHARDATITLDPIGSYLVTVIFLIAMSNAVNLIDGIDGLAVGVAIIASVACWAITLSPLLNQPAGAVLAATMAGACFGFLRYNFNPARIFLGDNGAYLIGFLLGCISCIGLVKKVTVVVISPILVLIFAVPIFDTLLAVCRRAMQQKAIMKPDLEHVHHKLMDLGMSQKQVNYLLYGITFISALIGCSLLGRDIALDFLRFSASIFSIWLFFSLVLNAKQQKWGRKN
jgi:UDP-GlcNAc:undecaprenyl-phosphate GlcNAc-1-phosphate transferase